MVRATCDVPVATGVKGVSYDSYTDNIIIDMVSSLHSLLLYQHAHAHLRIPLPQLREHIEHIV